MAQPAKYIMVINKIKEWIQTGKVKPGDKIYSENELSKMFQVSRHTIRQAIGELVHEGLLYREQGAGTFIAEQPEPLSPSFPNQRLRVRISALLRLTSLIIFFHRL